MNKQPIFIVGSSGHAKVVIDIVEKQGQYEIAGLLDAYKNKGEETLGYKILGKEDDLPELLKLYPGALILIAIGDNWIRHLVAEKLISVKPDLQFASAIHPSAQIAKNVTIGKGVVIMAGAVVNSESAIGDFTIINTKASIDHDGVMKPFSSLAPGVTAGGNVSIGAFSAISIGAVVKHGVNIGEHSVVGAGSVLLSHCKDHMVMYGVPAKEIRSRQAGDRYL